MAKFPNFVRVLTNTKSQFVEINGSIEKKIIFDQSALKITELLAQALKFTYQLIPAENTEIGRRLPNGSWTGMIGLVQRNETDMVIGKVAVTIQRLEVADFSYPYNRNRITFATRKPEYIAELLAFLLPFSLDVWFYSIAALLLFPAACFLLLKKKYTFRKLVFVAFKTIVSQDMGIEPIRSREYILLAFWQIGAGFLIFCYAGVLLSFLTFPKLSGIRTIPELAAAVAEGKYQCTTYPGGLISNVLLHSSDPKDRIIGLNLLKNKGSGDIEAVLGSKKSKKKPAFIGGDIDLLPYNLKYFISEDEFVPALRSVALRKNFCCRKQLDRVIGYVWASGIFEKMKQDHMFMESLRLVQRSPDILKKHQERPLSLEDLGGAFILIIFGYILATVVFIVEVIIGKRRIKEKNRRYLRQKKLLRLR